MFSRSAISRSFNAPHGMRINQAVRDGASRLWRKSFSTGRLRHSSSEGALSRQPVVLKEGYLSKPTFFRFGGKKRRWCVLRKFSSTEASIDLYVDDTKSRYKGSISLDRDAAPILIVKNADKKRKVSRQCYFIVKVGKSTFQFTCDSFRELTEWCALIRQAMDVGTTFSGLITEPDNISVGPVNIKFTSNCILAICPIKEEALKTWLLHKVTSFGQCGGMFTFEVCPQCSDHSSSVFRCSINLIQERPTIILNVLERMIRSNPNTSEIHYERSILGDIYHCGHDCTQPGRLMAAYSDPNIFSSGGSFSPPRTPARASVEVHMSEQVESIDSGLPGTPQPEELSNGIPSPTSSYRSNVFRSPRHQVYYPGEEEPDKLPVFRRRQSDETPSRRRSENLPPSPSYSAVRTADGSPVKPALSSHNRVQYALIDHSAPRMVHVPENHNTSVGTVHPPDHTSPTRMDHPQDHMSPTRVAHPPDHITPKIMAHPLEYGGESHQATPAIPTLTTGEAVTTDSMQRKEARNSYNKLSILEESTESTEEVDDVIYDVPNCEFLSDPFMPSPVPPEAYTDTAVATKSPTHHVLAPSPHHFKASPVGDSTTAAAVNLVLSPSPHHIKTAPVRDMTRSAVSPTLTPSPHHSKTISPLGSPRVLSPSHQVVHYTPGSDIEDRNEDYAWVSPLPSRNTKGGRGAIHPTPHPKNHVLATRDTGSRKRFQSSSDVLDAPTSTKVGSHRQRVDHSGAAHQPRTASMVLNSSERHLDQASNDFLKRLNEEEEKLSKVLAASRKERNEEMLDEARDRLGELNKPYMFALDDLDHDYSDPDTILETCSNLVDYHSTHAQPSYRVLPVHKEPTNNIKGYAYKVTIPYTNTQYDVPRRAAAAPDLTTMSHDAPPKPRRHVSTEHLYFVNS